MNSFPKVLSGIIGSFNDENRRNIAIAIYESGEISWSELKRKFQIQNGSLNYHLKALQKSGLIENVLSFEGEKERSVYRATGLLEKTLKAFRHLITPVKLDESFTKRFRYSFEVPLYIYNLFGASNSFDFVLNTGGINELRGTIGINRQKKSPKPAGDIIAECELK